MKLYEKFGGFIVEYDSPFDAIRLRGKFYVFVITAFFVGCLLIKACGSVSAPTLKALDEKIRSTESFQKYDKELEQRRLERNRRYGWDED